MPQTENFVTLVLVSGKPFSCNTILNTDKKSIVGVSHNFLESQSQKSYCGCCLGSCISAFPQ